MIDFETLGELSKALDGAWGHAIGTRDQQRCGKSQHLPGGAIRETSEAGCGHSNEQEAREPAWETSIAAGQEVELRFSFDLDKAMRALNRRR